MAGARRSCSPDRLGERRLHLRASGAPIHRRGPVLSGGGEGGSDRAFCRQGRLHSSSRPSSRRTGPGQPCHATRQRESRVRSIQRALSLIQCSSLRYDHPTEVRSGLTHFDHRCPATGGTRLGPRWRLLSRARDAARSERVGRSGPGNRTLPPWQPGSSLPGVGLRLGALFSSASAISACD